MTAKMITVSTPGGGLDFWRKKLVPTNMARPWHHTPPRHCIRETFSEGPAPGCVSSPWLKVWTFHYSDGTIEQLKQVIKL